MKEINRRTFLKIGGALAIGAATGESLLPISGEVNKITSQVTGLRAGNAAAYQRNENFCIESVNKAECLESYKEPTIYDMIIGVVVAPLAEECTFRELPSKLVDRMEWGRESHGADVFLGTGGLGMTRNELLVGIGSSVIFGVAHNITRYGIDIKTVPASQTVVGMAFWYLQRKFGVASNTFAHAWFNFRSLT